MNILSLCDGQSCGQVALERAGINVDTYYASEIEENPIKITQYNYPNTIQLGDMTKIDLTKLPKIDLILSGTPCFVAGTKVITNDGYKNIEEIKIGDFVLTHKNRYRKVLKVGSKLAKVNELYIDNVEMTIVTSNHPYYVKEDIYSNPTWKKVSELKTGNLIGVYNNGSIIWNNFNLLKKKDFADIVYNIEVEEDNSYTANNAIVHNCQGFSRNGKMLNFEDERSKLFFDFSRILKYIKENNNPDVKFLLENVEMKKEWKKIINEELGVEGQLINSKIVSAQSRPRVYWTNIDYEELKDKGCVLKNILEEVDTSNYINHQGILIDPQIKEKSRNLINVVDGEVRISQATKLGYIVANDGDGVNLQFPTSKTRRGRVIKQKSSTLDCGCDVCVYYDNIIRKFTINELEKLQTLPVDYTKCLDNLAARKKAIGNGWTVDVIVHILRGLKNKTK